MLWFMLSLTVLLSWAGDVALGSQTVVLPVRLTLSSRDRGAVGSPHEGHRVFRQRVLGGYLLAACAAHTPYPHGALASGLVPHRPVVAVNRPEQLTERGKGCDVMSSKPWAGRAW
jgi:hypothetical protein